MRKYVGIVLLLAATGWVAVSAQQAEDPAPVWAYGVPPLSQAGPAPGARAGGRGGRAGGPRGAGAGRRSAPPAPQHIDGSKFEFTSQQINNGYGPADWFPEDHPTMPDIVAHGRAPEIRACALCHLPNGKGRPENAPPAGQPHDYILQQLADFKAGLRHSAEPRKENTAEMIQIASNLTPEEAEAAATYFSSMKWTPWIRVVEADTIPTMRLQGNIFYSLEDGTTEPLGDRIVETPEDNAQARLRNPRVGFIAYVPKGAVARGEAIVTTGGNGKTLACTTCHGPDLMGVGTVPGIAGRSPSYLVRQLYDFQQGTRHGQLSSLMKPVVAHLTEDDMVNIVAYVSSRKP